MKQFRLSLLIAALFVGLVGTAVANDEHHMAGMSAAGSQVTVKGEIVDIVCYLDHQGMGEKHVECAKTCIISGLPVGLKGEDGKLYLVVGEHKSMNAQLAPLAAKTVTIKGKLVSRDGFNMIENAEIVK